MPQRDWLIHFPVKLPYSGLFGGHTTAISGFINISVQNAPSGLSPLYNVSALSDT